MSKSDTVRERVLRRMPEELWLSPRMVARMIGSTAPAVERTLFDMSAAGEVLMRRQAMAEEVMFKRSDR